MGFLNYLDSKDKYISKNIAEEIKKIKIENKKSIAVDKNTKYGLSDETVKELTEKGFKIIWDQKIVEKTVEKVVDKIVEKTVERVVDKKDTKQSSDLTEHALTRATDILDGLPDTGIMESEICQQQVSQVNNYAQKNPKVTEFVNHASMLL